MAVNPLIGEPQLWPFDPLDRGLLGEWRFDRNTGLTVPDMSGRAHNGTVSNLDWVSTQYGPGLNRIGANDQIVDCGNIPHSGQITAEVFLYLETLGAGGNPIAFAVHWFNELDWRIARRGSQNAWTFYVTDDGDEASQVVVTHPTATVNGTWYHLVGVADGATINIYQNGISAIPVNFANSVFSSTNSVSMFATTGSLIGEFEGTIVLARLYDRALSASEVRARYEIVTARASGLADIWMLPFLPRLVVGTTCWGHVTGVLEDNIRTFNINWTGTGEIQNVGGGDTERLALAAGEVMTGEVVYTDIEEVELLQNEYAAGDDVTMEYRHGATEAACLAAGWNNYVAHFTSLGYVQVRVTSTL